MHRDLPRWLTLAAIIALLAAIHAHYRTGDGPFGTDGSYYVQIARHVADGDGLRTSVSLYYLGLRPLPNPFVNSPLWPLLLGWTARAIGFLPAIQWLPQFFYLFDLFLLYLIVIPLFGPAAPLYARSPFDWGHVFVLLFGLMQPFFVSTAYPYTEGLAFAVAFGALLATGHIRPQSSIAWSLLAGLLAGAGILVRTKMLVLAAAIGMVIAAYAAIHRVAKHVIAFAIVLTPFAAWWFLRLNHVPAALHVPIPTFNMVAETRSVGSYVAERLTGLRVAYTLLSPYSYFADFFLAALLPPLALIAVLVWLWRRRRALPWPPPADSILTAAVLATGALYFAALNAVHESFFLPWLFGYRHGLFYILLVAASAAFLCRSWGRIGRGTVVVLVTLSILYCALADRALLAAPRQMAPTPAERAFAAWADGQRPLPTFLSADAQPMSSFSRANFHWISCDEPPQQTRMMLDKLPIDFMVLYDSERPCRFVGGLRDVVRPIAAFGDGPGRIWVLARRPSR